MIHVVPPNLVSFLGKNYRCVLGKSGVTNNKVEGDRATPVGTFPLLRVLYRPDRVGTLDTELPLLEIENNDGWCDDPLHKDYNKPIDLPHPASHEVLWRDDNVYDIIVVLGYNTSPIIPSKGSGIFIHCATPSYESTRGCIALDILDLIDILRLCSKETELIINAF